MYPRHAGSCCFLTVTEFSFLVNTVTELYSTEEQQNKVVAISVRAHRLFLVVQLFVYLVTEKGTPIKWENVKRNYAQQNETTTEIFWCCTKGFPLATSRKRRSRIPPPSRSASLYCRVSIEDSDQFKDSTITTSIMGRWC
jgi:hypothetical protein